MVSKKIAVDAMGGDHAPDEIVHGVAQALEAKIITAEEVILVGDETALQAFHQQAPALRDVEIRHASQQVTMDESPTKALRGKPDSSIQVALHLVKQGEAAAFVSAGNTGAVVATALMTLGRIPQVRRPGIAVSFHAKTGPVTIVDVGANIHCKPEHLYHYGVMADVFCREVFELDRPKVALLNIGEEQEKGNDLVRETRDLFERSNLHFIGNVEGNQLFSGRSDVVVCEGFVGNVVLKVTEGAASHVFDTLRKEFTGEGTTSADAGHLRKIMTKLDYAEYGGAPLLGVDGQVMIMHGRSNRRAMASSLRVAHHYMHADVSQKIRQALEEAER